MGRFGSRAQRDARDLFDERAMIIEKMNASSMEDIHRDIAKYEEYAYILNYMLEECEPWLSEEELAEELLCDPDYENKSYDLDEYDYNDRTWIYESEIRSFRLTICEKMEEYVKFLDELILNAIEASMPLS
jgi:hypothetical protein